MNFSIVLASRSRTELLKNLLESIKVTAKFIDQIEVFVGIDDDDSETHAVVGEFKVNYPFAKLESRQRSNFLNKDYINWLSSDHSKGKYLIICNDDTEFVTPNWDEIIENRMEAYLADKPDRIAYGFMSDALLNRHGMGYCCFPLITREGFNALGFSMPPEYTSWNADIALWRIYTAVGRICDLSEVMIKHISYHSGTRAPDHINAHVRSISNGGQSVDNHIARIRSFIGG